MSSEGPNGFGTVVLPGAPAEPCPELLTEDEAVRYLRLNIEGPKNPGEALRYYREKGLLRATRVGRKLRYRRVELESFLEQLTERSSVTRA